MNGIEMIKKILKRKSVKNGAWLYLLQIFNTVVPLLTLPYITRILGAKQYGIFSIAINVIGYYQVVVVFGYAKTAVGDKYVYEYMVKNDCRIGGEQSGHIIFSKYASTGDGILTSLKMMEVMLAKKKLMSELTAPLKIYPQVLENIRVTDKKAAQNDPAVQEAVSRVAEALGDTGRILVRESGTEPVVRVMVEAPDHDTCQKYVDEVVNVICEKGYKA